MVETSNVIVLGFVASLCASAGTAVGSLGVMFISSLSRKLEDGLLSVAAGIMLAATFFSLLLPGLEYAGMQHGEVLAVGIVSAGLLLGAVTLFSIHQHAPHEHFQLGREGAEATELSRIWLFVIAITLHNFPEGMAVGVGFAGGELSNGLSLALGIGLQNVPEGLAVAVALLSVGYEKTQAMLFAALTGLVEPIGGLTWRRRGVERCGADAVGAGIRCGRDAVYYQRRNHSRNAQRRQQESRHVQSARWLRHHDDS